MPCYVTKIIMLILHLQAGKLSLRIGVVPLLGELCAFPGILHPPSMGFSGKMDAHPLSVSMFACICYIAVPHILLASLS